MNLDLTESDIKEVIKNLQKIAEEGNMTVTQAQKLMELREQLRIIEKAKYTYYR